MLKAITYSMTQFKARKTVEIQSEILSNKEIINKLTEKISILKELIGGTQ